MSVSGAKPFSLQAPEAIAKQYQGNKQKIAQAIQLGLVDATAGTLAGMFIDRMRAAAMQEQGAPQTVAQQVLGSNPPAPPPGGPPMAPMAGGAPPPPMPMPMPQGAPPASSAAPMGGPPVQAAEGGLMSLPVPDTMFDEPEGTSMARGGLVAFADAGAVDMDEITVTAPERESYYGFFKDPTKMRAQIDAQYKPERQYGKELTEMFKGVSSPEELKRRKKDDMYMALAQIGATMATTPGGFLQAASAGINSALPGFAQAAKERRADQRDAVKALAAQEGLSNKEAFEMARLVQEGTNKYGEFDLKRLDRKQARDLAELQEKGANTRQGISASTSRYGSDTAAAATVKAAGIGFEEEKLKQAGLVRKLVYDQIGPGGALAIPYSEAVRAGTGKEFIAARVAELLGGPTNKYEGFSAKPG